jgi:hypothetical protein
MDPLSRIGRRGTGPSPKFEERTARPFENFIYVLDGAGAGAVK